MKGYIESRNGLILSCTETCLINNRICHPSAQCVYDSSGEYNCQCKQGFIGNGYYCKGNGNIFK